MTGIGDEVIDDEDQSRYEVQSGGETVSIADYVKQPGIVSFTHTETFAGHKGQGHAGRMIDRALGDARVSGVFGRIAESRGAYGGSAHGMRPWVTPPAPPRHAA